MGRRSRGPTACGSNKAKYVRDRDRERLQPHRAGGLRRRYMDLVKSGVVTVVAGDMFVIKVSKDLTNEYDAARLPDSWAQAEARSISPVAS